MMTASEGNPLPSSSSPQSDEAGRATTTDDNHFSFGPFTLFPGQGVLQRNGKTVQLGSRACEILVALVERAGELVDKTELMARVWPDVTVVEANLRTQMNGLRRVLAEGGAGDSYIATTPGRGYRFVAPVNRSASADARVEAAPEIQKLPSRMTRLIGREDVVAAVVRRLQRYRFVTIVGSGGIGKTAVALAVATGLAGSYKDGAHFIDLAPVRDPRLVASALGSVLGVAIRSENPYPALAAFLRRKQMLLVIDNCEHVAEAAANLAEEALKSSPEVHILATSREPLRAQGESLYRLQPLETAPQFTSLTLAEALSFPAVQLFAERAAASAAGYELNDGDVPAVAQICHKLDGIALAIELAASRVDAFGVAGIAARLNDRFRLLTQGRRTAVARHRTLGAAFDWSYEHLSNAEKVVMCRLGIFAGPFTLEAAREVAGDRNISPAEVENIVANLVEKSLVVADIAGDAPCYRFLDSGRAYALQKLTDRGEVHAVAHRHAQYLCSLMQRSEVEWETQATTEWLTTYAPHIDDLRAALEWANSPTGDATLGVALAAASVPLWSQMSLIEECRARAETALNELERGRTKDDRRRMQLYAAIALSQMYASTTLRDTISAWRTALEIAEALEDTDYQLRALWGMWGTCINRGEFRDALMHAKQFVELAGRKADRDDQLVGSRLIGVALHYLGTQREARQRIERMLAGYVAPARRSHAVRFQADQRVTARVCLARILWVLGFPDQAVRAAELSVDEALSAGHSRSLCNALAVAACPVSLLVGDLAAAEKYTRMLLDETAGDALDIWHAHGVRCEGQLLLRRGDLAAGLPRLRAATNQLLQSGYGPHLMAALCGLAEGLAEVGEFAEGLRTIEDAIRRAEHSHGHWCTAELFRVKGEIMMRAAAQNAAPEAEEYFLKSLELARQQQAAAWELRAATSLARLRRDQGHIDEACKVLAPVYRHFGEGHETFDLKAAKKLLDQLGWSPPPPS